MTKEEILGNLREAVMKTNTVRHFIESNYDSGQDAEKTDHLTFGEAFAFLKKGRKVTRQAWMRDCYIKIQYPDASSKITTPYLYFSTGFEAGPLFITNCDLFAEDWEVFKD